MADEDAVLRDAPGLYTDSRWNLPGGEAKVNPRGGPANPHRGKHGGRTLRIADYQELKPYVRGGHGSGNPYHAGYGTWVPGLPEVECPECERQIPTPAEDEEPPTYLCECSYEFSAVRELDTRRGKDGGPYLPKWSTACTGDRECAARTKVIRAFYVVVEGASDE